MIVIKFGRWSSCTRRIFIYNRIYTRKGRWTPFCKIKKRYATLFADYKKEGAE